MELKKFTRLTMLLSLSVVLNIIESIVPIFNGFIPGLKLGLANSVVILVLYIFSYKDALYLSILRVFIVGILRTGIFSIAFCFSLGGAIFSIIVMSITKKYTKLSIIGVSILGSIAHSLGQIGIAILIFNSFNLIYYLPFLLIFAIPTGILVGVIGKELVKYFEKRLKYFN